MKKIFVFCFVVLIGTLSSQVPTVGLISQWPFSGNANDIIGGNNSSVVNATLTPDRFGNPNCAYNFNGTSSYIRMLNAGPTGTLSRSVSFWAKSTNTTLTCAFAYGAAPGALAIQFYYGCPGVGCDIGTAQFIRTNTLVANGSWHHYAMVYDNTLGTQMGVIKLYVDAVLASVTGCGSTTSLINSNATFPINIGKVADNNIRFFKGDLDDFFLYNRALTPTEVLALYNDTPCLLTPPSPGSINGSITVCQGASVVYSVAPVAGATSYTWSLPGGWTGTSTTNTISVIAGANSGQITVASGNCCGSSQPSTQDVTVNPAPVVSITATQFTVCNGNSTTLSANGASTYTWSPFIVTPSITVSPSVTSSYTVSGTNSFGCSSTTVTSVVVTNNMLPTILINGSGISCPGQTVNIAANGALTYTWQPGALNGFFVSVTPTVTTVYTVTGTDANGCYNSATYTQSVSTCAGVIEAGNKDLSIIISPNPNNGNFTIHQKNLKEKTTIEIYSNIGQLVFSKVIEKAEEHIETKLATGTYFVMLRESNNLKAVQRLVITQ